VETALQNLNQGDTTVTTYFTNLTRNWQQLDLFEIHDWKCPEDGAKYRGIVETKRVFKFLMGLNKSLDEVRGRILATKPIPNLREAFSEVRREESRRKVMLGQSVTMTTSEGSAMMSHGSLPSPEDASAQVYAARGPPHHLNDNRPRRGRPWCDHCRKPGHTKDTCWKLHGKPVDWKPSRGSTERESRGNAASTELPPTSSQAPFTKDQIEVLQRLIS